MKECCKNKSQEWTGVAGECCCICKHLVELRTEPPSYKLAGYACLGIYRADNCTGTAQYEEHQHGLCELFISKEGRGKT